MSNAIETDAKIYVAGHRGLLGSALVRELLAAGYKDLILRTHSQLDLTDPVEVSRLLAAESPEIVFLAAAKVGGILVNHRLPAEFIHDNLAIQNNIIHQSFRNKVRRLIFIGSSCIYPRDCPQPIKEEYLLTGALEPTNRPYAIAKIAGIELCWAYNRQHGTNFLAAMPTNLFGPNDNYDLETSHVVPALIRKMGEAKTKGSPHVVVWGTGRPRREFLYSDDAANACVFLMNLSDDHFGSLTSSANAPPLINIGAGRDLTIVQLAELVREVVGFKGNILFDQEKPDGTMRKLLDTSRLERFGWRPRMQLREGIQRAYQDYLQCGFDRSRVNDVVQASRHSR